MIDNNNGGHFKSGGTVFASDVSTTVTDSPRTKFTEDNASD